MISQLSPVQIQPTTESSHSSNFFLSPPKHPLTSVGLSVTPEQQGFHQCFLILGPKTKSQPLCNSKMFYQAVRWVKAGHSAVRFIVTGPWKYYLFPSSLTPSKDLKHMKKANWSEWAANTVPKQHDHQCALSPFMLVTHLESSNGKGWKGPERSSGSNPPAMSRDIFH